MIQESNANSNYNQVLDKIVTIRTAQKITQLELAEHLKLGEGGYFKIERGMRKLDLERLFEILEFLEISPSEFFKEFTQ